MNSANVTLNINEIFTSIDGEVNLYGQGRLTTFVRFAGCNLCCPYCDTKQALKPDSGEEMSIDDIFSQIVVPKVTITGGEPLMQMKGILALFRRLIGNLIPTTVETNGSILIPFFNSSFVSWVIDFKLDNAKEMIWSNFDAATHKDWIKIVLNSEDDIFSAIRVVQRIREVNESVNIAFGFTDKIVPALVVEKLIAHKLWDVILNFQIHKFVGLK